MSSPARVQVTQVPRACHLAAHVWWRETLTGWSRRQVFRWNPATPLAALVNHSIFLCCWIVAFATLMRELIDWINGSSVWLTPTAGVPCSNLVNISLLLNRGCYQSAERTDGELTELVAAKQQNYMPQNFAVISDYLIYLIRNQLVLVWKFLIVKEMFWKFLQNKWI